MTEASPTSAQAGRPVATRERRPTTASTVDHADGSLATGRGTTRIDDSVVEKVAGSAAREVDGVHSLSAGLGGAVAGAAQRVGLGDERSQGVSVEVGEREAAVDLDAVLQYGAPVPRVAQQLRDYVSERIQAITGLRVIEINVTVSDIRRASDQDAESHPRVH